MINDHQVTNNDHRPQHYDGIIVGFGGWMFLVDFALSYLGESIFNIFNALFMVDDDTILWLIQVKESPIPGAGEGNFAAQEIFQKDFNIDTILILIHLYWYSGHPMQSNVELFTSRTSHATLSNAI